MTTRNPEMEHQTDLAKYTRTPRPWHSQAVSVGWRAGFPFDSFERSATLAAHREAVFGCESVTQEGGGPQRPLQVQGGAEKASQRLAHGTPPPSQIGEEAPPI